MDESALLLSELAETKRLLTSVEKTLYAGREGIVLVTSAVGREGKTMLSAALAIAAARNGRNVLAMDLDWYKPELHEKLGCSRSWRHGQASLDNLMELARPTSIDGLFLLSAPQEGAEGINVNELGERLADLAQSAFDLIVVDTPSVFPVNRRMLDPVQLARRADIVLFVVRTNYARAHETRRAKELLAVSVMAPLGLVINHWQDQLWNTYNSRGKRP